MPSDVRGIQRLEYSRYDYTAEKGLGDCLISILKGEGWVKNIESGLKRKISDGAKIERCLYLSLRLIAHLRDYEKLTTENLRSMIRGTRLRKEIIEKILDVLEKLKFLRKGRGSTYFRRKTFFGKTRP